MGKPFENPFADLREPTAYRNWDSTRRLEETRVGRRRRRGAVPEHHPAVLPVENLTAHPPKAGEHELRWEGLKAHNRWLADFCADTPGRRAGMAQILLHDVDAAVEEIRWAKEAGLFGGVLLPGIPPDTGLYAVHRPGLRTDLGDLRRARHADQPPRRQRRTRLRAVPGDRVDVLRRSRLLLPPGAVDADLRRSVRPLPEPQAHPHRRRRRLAARRHEDSRPPVQPLCSKAAHRSFALMGTSEGSGEAVQSRRRPGGFFGAMDSGIEMLAERVLPAERLDRVELHRAPRSRPSATTSASTR